VRRLRCREKTTNSQLCLSMPILKVLLKRSSAPQERQEVNMKKRGSRFPKRSSRDQKIVRRLNWEKGRARPHRILQSSPRSHWLSPLGEKSRFLTVVDANTEGRRSLKSKLKGNGFRRGGNIFQKGPCLARCIALCIERARFRPIWEDTLDFWLASNVEGLYPLESGQKARNSGYNPGCVPPTIPGRCRPSSSGALPRRY